MSLHRLVLFRNIRYVSASDSGGGGQGAMHESPGAMCRRQLRLGTVRPHGLGRGPGQTRTKFSIASGKCDNGTCGDISDSASQLRRTVAIFPCRAVVSRWQVTRFNQLGNRVHTPRNMPRPLYTPRPSQPHFRGRGQVDFGSTLFQGLIGPIKPTAQSGVEGTCSP